MNDISGLPSHLTMAQFARLHGVQMQLVARWVRSGKVPSENVLMTIMVPSEANLPTAQGLDVSEYETLKGRIQALRETGISVRGIAAEVGLSRSKVERVVKELKRRKRRVR
jgi:hypothetical protein